MFKNLIICALAVLTVACTSSDQKSFSDTETECISLPESDNNSQIDTPLVTLNVWPDKADTTCVRLYIQIQDSTQTITDTSRARYCERVSELTKTDKTNIEKAIAEGIAFNADNASHIQPWIDALTIFDKVSQTDGKDLIIAADKNTDYKTMNTLFECLKHANLNKFVLMTSLKTE